MGFCSDRSYECAYKFEVRSFTVPEIIGGTFKNWVAHAPLIVLNIFNGRYSYSPSVRYRRTDGRTDDGRHAIAIPRFALKCIAR